MITSCVVCDAASETYLCDDVRTHSGCLRKLLSRLDSCIALADELDTSLSRQARHSGAAVGYVSSGSDEQPLPLDTASMDTATLLRDRLGLWVRDLWETHAPRDADGSFAPVDVANTIPALARWLQRHPTWMSCHPAAYELYDEVSETIRLAWASVDATPTKAYIGRCSTIITDWYGDDLALEGPAPMCLRELYAREGMWEVRCPDCGAIHDVRQRQDVLADAVERQFVPVGLLVGLVTDRGHHLTTSMLRNLRSRGRITAYVHDAAGVEVDQHGQPIRPRLDVDTAPCLYRVGDVLDAITNRYRRAGVA